MFPTLPNIQVPQLPAIYIGKFEKNKTQKNMLPMPALLFLPFDIFMENPSCFKALFKNILIPNPLPTPTLRP